MKKLFLPLIIIPAIGYSQLTDDEMIKKGIDINEHVPVGLKVGDMAPEINTISVDGIEINSNKVLKEKEIVVIFYRGNWCPYCNRNMSNINDSLKYIKETGAEVLVVGPENFKTAEKTKEKSKSDVNFVLIPDTSMKIMEGFDVLFRVTKKYDAKIKTFLFTDIAKNNGQENAKLPVPATYIIGKDGKVKWRHFNHDYTKRASAQSIINHLE